MWGTMQECKWSLNSCSVAFSGVRVRACVVCACIYACACACTCVCVCAYMRAYMYMFVYMRTCKACCNIAITSVTTHRLPCQIIHVQH